MERVFHNAKIGDIVYSLPAIYRRGGVKEYHIQREHAAEYLRPLLESQPYIGAVIHSKNCPDNVDVNFESYQAFYRLMLGPDLIKLNMMCAGVRSHHFPLKLSGVTLHSEHVKYMDGIHFDLDKHRDLQGWSQDHAWLKVDPVHVHDVIINRSPRYNEDYFDYTLLEYHDCGFIGLKEEYDEFIKRYGFAHYVKIDNALDVAKYIAGSKLFVGNQSSCKAIAEGLKHPRLVEISKNWPDSMPIGKYGHITITEELVEKYLTKEHDRVIMKEFNNEKEIKSVGLTEFFS
mgnify:FL=1